MRNRIIAVSYSAKDTGFASLERSNVYPCIFEGFPTDFKKHSLLRVHALDFLGRKVKKGAVKAINRLLKKPGPVCCHLSWNRWIRIIIHLSVPSILRDFADGVAPAFQQGAIFFDVARSSRKAAGHSDNGNLFLARILYFVKSLLSRLQRLVQRLECFVVVHQT